MSAASAIAAADAVSGGSVTGGRAVEAVLQMHLLLQPAQKAAQQHGPEQEPRQLLTAARHLGDGGWPAAAPPAARRRRFRQHAPHRNAAAGLRLLQNHSSNEKVYVRRLVRPE